MLKISESQLLKLDADYPGLRETILKFESLDLPPCSTCTSANSASVQMGIVGRSIALAGANIVRINGLNGALTWIGNGGEVVQGAGSTQTETRWSNVLSEGAELPGGTIEGIASHTGPLFSPCAASASWKPDADPHAVGRSRGARNAV